MNDIKPMSELDTMVALNDAAAHARALAHQYVIAVETILKNYPNVRLGGMVEQLKELALHSAHHAQALTEVADRAMCTRPEVKANVVTFGQAVPQEVLALFESATVILHPVSVEEAGQAAAGGKLVVLRDPATQGERLVRHYGAIFEASVDPALVRLWWPRVFHQHAAVAIVETEVDGVWQETTLAVEAVDA